MNFTQCLSIAALAAGLSATSNAQTIEAGPGFELAGSVDLGLFCDVFPAVYTFVDGSTLMFDGTNISRRSADGTTLRDYGTFPFSVFASFLKVDEASGMAYFGESSTGAIRSLDLDSGIVQDLTNLMFNYDLAFDVVPGQAYVVASAFGSATNSLFRIDLTTGQTVQVADIGGFSGPVAVDNLGNVFVGVLPGTFPFPADSVKIVRFDAMDVTSGAILTDETDGFDFSTGYDGMSAADYDPRTDSIVVVETSTGTNGSESVTWRLDSTGARAEEVLRTPGFASGTQVVNGNASTVFAGYQPAQASVRVQFSQCFSNGDSGIYNVTPKRPEAVFFGPGSGVTGSALVDIEGGIPNGFASLWVARSGAYEFVPVLESIGSLYPVLLRADAADFGRQFAPIPLSTTGGGGFQYTQTPALEGAILFQWVVFDENMNLVTTSTAVVNQ